MPDAVRLPIYGVFSQAKQAVAAGDHGQAVQLCEDAWSRIPEPRFGWDVSYVCLGAFVKFMRAGRSYDKPIETVTAYIASPYRNDYEDGPFFWLGTLHYEKGEHAKAFEYFERANAMSKGRCFVEEDPRYKEFFRTYKTRPQQKPSLASPASRTSFELIDSTEANPDEIAGLETRLGWQLPADYTSFLVENNGGECVSGGEFRKLATGEVISEISAMLGIRDDPDLNIESHLLYLDGRAPDQLLPIAYDSDGNYLLLDCSDARRGRIYFLSLDAQAPDKPPRASALSVVASTFTDFRAQLESNRQPT